MTLKPVDELVERLLEWHVDPSLRLCRSFAVQKDLCDPAAEAIFALAVENERLKEALATAVRVAEEARQEWDAAPSGMKAGKLLIALGGNLPGYRSDIDTIHEAIARAALSSTQPGDGADRKAEGV